MRPRTGGLALLLASATLVSALTGAASPATAPARTSSSPPAAAGTYVATPSAPAAGAVWPALAHTDSVSAPCGRIAPPSGGYRHVVWIWLENRSYDTVIGGPGSWARGQAPYLNRLAARCGLATNYHNVSHPSQPNYFAAVAGTTGGVHTNCEPSTCSLPAIPTLFGQVAASGRQWRSYEENMPGPCVAKNVGTYVDRHNPEVYFPSDAAQCQASDLPMGTLSAGPFAAALDTNRLPAFSFVTPDVCTDMHSCPTRTGDDWLARWVPRIVASPGYRQGSTAVFITFDEGEGGHSYQCATDTTDVGCHVATVVVAPSTPAGTRSGVLFNHYSLLRTTEELLGIRPLLGHAGDSGTNSMVGAFGL
ncbi:MAG: phosphatidylinositol-3-phosphatase [Frankiales bacterium]|nr:phosphatidylinositol-3-phosphatase [Frankiales bacterium]